jgi:3-oxoacyl-[acyl-carrier protein] reductase
VNEPNPGSLAGRVALVTGAAGGGCGTAVARALAGAGATVYVNGLARHRAALSALAESGARLVPCEADVGCESDVETLVRRIVAGHGGLDVVVHNAAPALPPSGIGALTTATWHADVRTILDGAFYLSRAASTHLAARGYGRLVFISSSAAFRGAHGRSAGYAAAKAGLHGLVVQLALELGPTGTTVNALAPSQVDTPRVRRGGRRDDDSLRRYAERVPLRRAGRPADVASAVLFLASPASAYLTGQVIRLDGGSALAGVETAVQGHG